MSVTLMGLVLNCLERLAPWRAAPKTAASSALTFKAILSLMCKLKGRSKETASRRDLLSNRGSNRSLDHGHSSTASSQDNRGDVVLKDG